MPENIKGELTDIEIVASAVKSLDEKKARDIKVIRIRDLTILSNYFVLATGTSSTQVKALADEVEHKLGEKGLTPKRTEGYQGASWIILDYIDVVVHVFYEETRNFYDLERLWQDGEFIDCSEFLPQQENVK